MHEVRTRADKGQLACLARQSPPPRVQIAWAPIMYTSRFWLKGRVQPKTQHTIFFCARPRGGGGGWFAQRPLGSRCPAASAMCGGSRVPSCSWPAPRGPWQGEGTPRVRWPPAAVVLAAPPRHPTTLVTRAATRLQTPLDPFTALPLACRHDPGRPLPCRRCDEQRQHDGHRAAMTGLEIFCCQHCVPTRPGSSAALLCSTALEQEASAVRGWRSRDGWRASRRLPPQGLLTLQTAVSMLA